MVGESNYQDELRQVSGAPVTGDWKFECVSRLVPEPTNVHDAKAVMVQIDGVCVGYLSRRNASVFGPRVRRIIASEGEAVCAAFVGRRGDSDNPNLGVRLRAPEDSPLFRKDP